MSTATTTTKFDNRNNNNNNNRNRKQTNLIEDLYKRDIESSYIADFKSKHVFSHRLVKQLNLEAELRGHDGCVNCLEWNQAGNILASGSDDQNIMIWRPFSSTTTTRRPSQVIPTKHRGNIFGVKFLPHTNDSLVGSCAADRDIFIYDVNHSSRTFQQQSSGSVTYQGDLPPPLHSIQSHVSRVKRLETSQSEPFLVWSCGEDGLVLEHDIRLPKAECSRIVLAYDSATARIANATAEKNTIVGRTATGKKEYRLASLEAKCLSVNQIRSEYLAVGCNDPFARIYDRRALRFRRMPDRGINNSVSAIENSLFEYTSSLSENDNIPVSFFVPGHLPFKIDEYRKRMKTLSITFLTFSPSGDQLLVNLGGEQLYLYDFVPSSSSSSSDSTCFKFDFYKELFKSSSSSSNNARDDESSEKNSQTTTTTTTTTTKKSSDLAPKAEALKAKANACFESKHYVEAIEYYNKAIEIASNSPILYGNRAAALMKRLWEGDVYSAMRDCYQALTLDPSHLKSHFRLSKCLNELGWYEDARDCLKIFSSRFPDYARTPACESLLKEINESLKKTSSSPPPRAATTSTSSSSTGKKSSHKRFKHTHKDDDETADTDGEDTDNTSSNKRKEKKNRKKEDEEESSDDNSSYEEDDDEDDQMVKMLSSQTKRSKRLIERYVQARSNACDFKKRYCGHCNVATDIKEANFLGEEFIAAGSDDGCIFIWEKSSTNIVRVLKGDDSIVNCVQPHPSSCYVATSGIDPHVRLWAPKLPDVDVMYKKSQSHKSSDDDEEDKDDYDDDDDDEESGGDRRKSRVIHDVRSAEMNNHRQMNSHPFEFLFLNLAQTNDWNNDESDEPGENQSIRCRPS